VRPSQKLIALAFPKKFFWKIYTSAKFKKIANVYEIRILRPSRNFAENLWLGRTQRTTS